MSRRLRAVLAALPLAALLGCAGTSSSAVPATLAATSSVTTTAPATTAVSTTARPTTVVPTTPSSNASSSPAETTSDAAAIPAAFLGSWNLVKVQCGTVSEGSLTVQPGYVRFYEGGGPVISVVQSADLINVTIMLTSEGTTEARTFQLTVSTDGQKLTDLTNGTVRLRCP